MNQQRQYTLENYQEILAKKGCHTYAKKRAIVHLAKITTLENILAFSLPNTQSQPFAQQDTYKKACKEAQKIIQLEEKKLWVCFILLLQRLPDHLFCPSNTE